MPGHDDGGPLRSRRCTCAVWAGKDSNLRRLCRQIYSLLPLATRAPTLGAMHCSRPAPGLCTPNRAAAAGRVAGHAQLRRRLRDRHARGAQRRRPGRPRGGQPVRLQGHRLVDRARRPARSRSPRSPRTGSPPSARCSRRSWSSARCRSRPSTTARSRRPRAAPPARSSRSSPASPRQGHRHQQVHQGARPQGRAEPGAGRAAPGQRQEARRPAGRHRRAPRSRTSASPCSSTTSATDRAARPGTDRPERHATGRAATRPRATRRRAAGPPGPRWWGACATGCRSSSCGPTAG